MKYLHAGYTRAHDRHLLSKPFVFSFAEFGGCQPSLYVLVMLLDTKSYNRYN